MSTKGGKSIPQIVSPGEWQGAREKLLVKEKAITRSLDALAAERRRLPMALIDKKYVFDGPKGKVSLLELFEGRRQLILWFSAFAHLIMSTLQAEVLKGTELESASIGQIRLRLFKIAARLKTSFRRIHIELCSAYPLKALFSLVHQRLSALGSPA